MIMKRLIICTAFATLLAPTTYAQTQAEPFDITIRSEKGTPLSQTEFDDNHRAVRNFFTQTVADFAFFIPAGTPVPSTCAVNQLWIDTTTAAAWDLLFCQDDGAGGTEWVTTAGGGGSLTVQEVDGTPSLTATTIQFDQADGLTVTDLGSGVAQIDSTGGGGSPGGADEQIQYNNAGAFGGDPQLTWDDGLDQLEILHASNSAFLRLSGDEMWFVDTAGTDRVEITPISGGGLLFDTSVLGGSGPNLELNPGGTLQWRAQIDGEGPRLVAGTATNTVPTFVHDQDHVNTGIGGTGNVSLIDDSTQIAEFSTVAITFPSLVSCDTIDTDASGVLSCGVDAGGTAPGGVAGAVQYSDGAGGHDDDGTHFQWFEADNRLQIGVDDGKINFNSASSDFDFVFDGTHMTIGTALDQWAFDTADNTFGPLGGGGAHMIDTGGGFDAVVLAVSGGTELDTGIGHDGTNSGVAIIDEDTEIASFDSTDGVTIPSLVSCDTIDTDASGILSCGTDAGGGSGDEIQVEDGDDAGTFTAIDTTASFEDQGDINFAVTDGGAGGPDAVTGVIRADAIEESMLKAVDAAGDEECLTFETTTGDFEWQPCGGGSSEWTDSGAAGTLTPNESDDDVQEDATTPTWMLDAAGHIGTDTRLRLGDADSDANSACIGNDADRLFHDTDCDGVNDAGEEFIDSAPSGGTVVVQEADTTVSTADTIDFDGTDFNVTESPTGEANISLAGGGGSSIVLDLDDDGTDESTGITEIATVNDRNSVMTEPAADKALIDFEGVAPFNEYDPDKPPGTCDACEEFTGDTESLTWRWGNQGTATISYKHDEAVLDDPTGSGSNNRRIRWTTISDPTSDFTVTSKCAGVDSGAADPPACHLAILVSGTEASPTTIQFIDHHDTSFREYEGTYTSSASSIVSFGTNDGPGDIESRADAGMPVCMQARYDSGTNDLDMYISADCIHWFFALTQNLGGNPTSSVGYGANVDTDGNNPIYVDWFRVRTDAAGLAGEVSD